MRWLVVLLLVFGRAAPAAGEASVPSPHAIDIPKWFTESFLDIREDVRDAAREGKRLMLYFGQDGCPYCKALMKVNFGDPAIVATTRAHFVPVALNIWGDREVTWIDGRKMSEKELARVLRVQYTPTLLFFDEQGAVALRLNGYSPPDKFRVALDYVRGRHETKQAFADYQAGLAPEPPGGKLATQPFFEKGPPDLARALASGKPVVVVFERASCRECAEMHRDGFARPEVRKALAGFKVLQANAFGGERDWARSLQVVYTPTLVFFDRSGQEVFRVEGYVRAFHLASALEYVAGGGYRSEPSFQRFVQQRADRLRAAGKSVDLME
jgi:thioredoxin-related protein